jgi:hypothetical protein
MSFGGGVATNMTTQIKVVKKMMVAEAFIYKGSKVAPIWKIETWVRFPSPAPAIFGDWM